MTARTDLGQKEVVYYDSNIWVSYMLGRNDNFYSICKPLIEDIERKRRVLLLSHT